MKSAGSERVLAWKKKRECVCVENDLFPSHRKDLTLEREKGGKEGRGRGMPNKGYLACFETTRKLLFCLVRCAVLEF